MTTPSFTEQVRPDRDRVLSLKRGIMGRCPHCGEGSLFVRYLKVTPQCTVCGEEFYHHRADDMPPYLTIFIVGHIVIPGMVMAELDGNWPLWWHIALWPTLTLLLSLLLLQPIKGAVVALQWALRMHGFSSSSPSIPTITTP